MNNGVIMKYQLSLGFILCIFPAIAMSNDRTELGFGLGSPALVNFVVKKDIAKIPLQASGFFWGGVRGIELGCQLYQNETGHFNSLQAVVGSLRVKDAHGGSASSIGRRSGSYYKEDGRWDYIGISATFRFGKFYIEPGVASGSGTYTSSVTGLLQFGWLWSLE